MKRSLSATSSQKARPARLTKKLSSMSINAGRFGKSLPRISRARAMQNSAGRRTIKRRRSPVVVSPNHELETSTSEEAPSQEAKTSTSPRPETVAGHVAMGPWAGPYEVSPLVVADPAASDNEEEEEDELELSPTLLDDAGGSQFAMKYLADEALADEGITSPSSGRVAAEGASSPSAASASKQPAAAGTAGTQAHARATAAPAGRQTGARADSPTNFGGLSEEDSERLRKKMEEAAQLKAAVWASHPVPRKVSRQPKYDRGAAHGLYNHARALYNVQQPRTRNMNKSQ